jgi:prefoldin subunit 5
MDTSLVDYQLSELRSKLEALSRSLSELQSVEDSMRDYLKTRFNFSCPFCESSILVHLANCPIDQLTQTRRALEDDISEILDYAQEIRDCTPDEYPPSFRKDSK